MNKDEFRALLDRLLKLERMLEETLRPDDPDILLESYEDCNPIPIATIIKIENYMGKRIDFMAIT